MPYLNPTYNMDVNYGGKHKHKSYKEVKKIQSKALRIINFQKPCEPNEKISL